MSEDHLPDYFSVANPAELRREYPLGDDFLARFAGMSRDGVEVDTGSALPPLPGTRLGHALLPQVVGRSGPGAG